MLYIFVVNKNDVTLYPLNNMTFIEELKGQTDDAGNTNVHVYVSACVCVCVLLFF